LNLKLVWINFAHLAVTAFVALAETVRAGEEDRMRSVLRLGAESSEQRHLK